MPGSSAFVPAADHFVIHQFDPRTPTTGGIDTFIRGLVKYAPDEHEFAIAGVDASAEGRPLGKWYRDTLANREVWFMPVARLHPNQDRRLPHGLRLMGGLARYRPKVREATIEVHRPDTALGVSTLYARSSITLYIHGDWSGGASPAQHESLWRHYPQGYGYLERLSLHRVDRTFLVGPARSAHLKRDTVRSIATWFDPEFFHMSGRSAKSGLRVIWVGRLEQGKDPLLAMRAFAELAGRMPEATLTVVGEGSMAARTRAECARLGVADRVTFTGFLSSSALGDAHREHDVFLFTSETGEGFSIALSEALACGVSATVTEAADPNGVVVNGLNGARARGRAPEDLADALLDAARCAPQACADSVAQLSATTAVPALLAMQPMRVRR